METTIPKEIGCVLCDQTFAPVFEPENGKNGYKIYCSSCANWLPITTQDPVRKTLRHLLDLGGEALALALEDVLARCVCGGQFVHDAGKRCPECLRKIQQESRDAEKKNDAFQCPWDLEALKKYEPKVLGFILEKMDSREESLTSLIQKFEAGEIDAETYMEGIESLQFREAAQISAIQTWAIMLGPEAAFRAAEEHGLVDRYGTRILVSIASALEMSTGRAVIAMLNREKQNWEGPVKKELNTFIAKIGGGF